MKTLLLLVAVLVVLSGCSANRGFHVEKAHYKTKTGKNYMKMKQDGKVIDLHENATLFKKN